MAERFTDKVMRRIEGERIRTIDERIMPVEALPDLLEAVSLEKGVFVEFNEYGGHIVPVVRDGKKVMEAIPVGHALVRVFTGKVSLSTFWNTFDALREYNQPISQS